MQAFATLLERLAFTPGRDARIALLGRYFATVPDPDRGFGLAALAGGLRLPAVGASLIRTLIAARTDPVLFALSYDYVGDLAETAALLWPARPGGAAPPALSEVVGALAATPRSGLPDLLAGWLDAAEAPVRYALLKLVTGGLRAGISGRLARRAVAAWGGLDPAAVEEVWHGLEPPYGALFAWAEGRAPRPDPAGAPLFRPPMLAHPITAAEVAALDPDAYRAEWKWDGIRVQLVATPAGRRLFSRGADDISAAFPEILAAMTFHAVLDGELLALAAPPDASGSGARDAGLGAVAPFSALQRRLNRLSPGAALRRSHPVGVRLYDLLFDGAEDLRALPFDTRRARLEAWFARAAPTAMDLSPLLAFADPAGLARLRAEGVAAGSEGLMLKRRDSAYFAGRPRGLWWKWKHEPRRIDAVLMYAQRGHGKRGGSYSDYTFGVWDGAALVPVGKAYFGFTDNELRWLDQWIRAHTIGRFGPVREVEKALVLEVAFDSAQASARHKSGVALRFPRISRLRRDKPAAEADRLETVLALTGGKGQAGAGG
jgi:DNA ligase-1